MQAAELGYAGSFQNSEDTGPKMEAVIPLAAHSANHSAHF